MPYDGSLDSVSGNEIRVRGVIDLPVAFGTVVKTLSFVHVKCQHVYGYTTGLSKGENSVRTCVLN